MLLLNWAIMTLSLTNTTLLFWLGFTVLLTAERHTWGARILGGGMLVSALFFVSHTAIVGNGLTSTDPTMTIWWYLGLFTALLLPYVWYVEVLWYTGFWTKHKSPPYRQRLWFALSSASTLALIGLLLFANPFPSYEQVITLNLAQTPTIMGVPLLIVAYATSTLANILFSLDALTRPLPSTGTASDLVRRHARPWMLATCLALLAVSSLVAAVMVWVVLKYTIKHANVQTATTKLCCAAV